MSRYTEAACKLCRREGVKLFLKGDRCLKAVCAIDRGRNAPGMHQRKGKLSGYGEQLRAKQKIRRFYGIQEAQFRKIYAKAAKIKGVTSLNLLIQLEMRLDNVVYRLGLAPSRSAARQFVGHGHVKVNGRRCNIPSYTVKPNDAIQIKTSDRSKALSQKNLEFQSVVSRPLPGWLTFDKESLKGQIVRLPEKEEIQVPADEQMVVELYSK